MPTTLIWGDRDRWGAPEAGEAAAVTNPLLRVVRVPGAGHAVWIDDPDGVVEEIERALDGA